MATRLAFSGLVVAVGAILSGPAQNSGTTTSYPVSASVVASWIVAGVKDRPQVLELLVLWRGSPGWFDREDSSEAARGTPDRTELSLKYGDLRLEISFERRGPTAKVMGQTLALQDNNVILVDNVDQRHILSVKALGRIPPAIPSDGRFVDLLVSAKQLHPYLRCELEMRDSTKQKLLGSVCKRISERFGVEP